MYYYCKYLLVLRSPIYIFLVYNPARGKKIVFLSNADRAIQHVATSTYVHVHIWSIYAIDHHPWIVSFLGRRCIGPSRLLTTGQPLLHPTVRTYVRGRR
jgi:hypothetical protein